MPKRPVKDKKDYYIEIEIIDNGFVAALSDSNAENGEELIARKYAADVPALASVINEMLYGSEEK